MKTNHQCVKIKRRPLTPVDETDRHNLFVPGKRNVPPYPKLSSMTVKQQMSILRVLCAYNANVLPLLEVSDPTEQDSKVYKEMENIYMSEQREYIEWAKSMWSANHHLRALRPKPIVETVYDTEFQMRANRMRSFPKKFEIADHIAMSDEHDVCVMALVDDLISVDMHELPKVEIPELCEKFTIMQPCPMPEPCNIHPCWFRLPNEEKPTKLPLTEVNRQLAQFALDNGAQYIASEGALKCLVEKDRQWMIPITVCKANDSEGDKKVVIVLGSEFSTTKRPAMERTYRAFRHLLDHALQPFVNSSPRKKERDIASGSGYGRANVDVPDGKLFVSHTNCRARHASLVAKFKDHHIIDIEDLFDCCARKCNNPATCWVTKKLIESSDESGDENSDTESTPSKGNNPRPLPQRLPPEPDDSVDCPCKDAMIDSPPPRSYKKWCLRNYTIGDELDLIVHCAHKMRGEDGELITEPIVEYQVDLGGCEQSIEKKRSLALSIYLRDNASLLAARIENSTGEMVTIDDMSIEDLTVQQDLIDGAANALYDVLVQIQELNSGHYILHNKVPRGSAAYLYSLQVRGVDQKLTLNFDNTMLSDAEEANSVKIPPMLTDVLLPVHKYRRILPCAFTPYEALLPEAPKKTPAKKNVPPQALRWPRNKKRKQKRSRHTNTN